MALKITQIPIRYRVGLAKMKDLSESQINAITAALEKPAAGRGLRQIISTVEKEAGISAADADAITVTLHSLYVLKATSESSVAELVPILLSAMEATGKSLTMAEGERPKVSEKLMRLLSLTSLERASKVEQLKADHSTIFVDAKILTDLRPVFDLPTDPPIGTITGHTLKIICHERGEHRELYFALDLDDIKTLKTVAERAEKKTASLKAFTETYKINDLS